MSNDSKTLSPGGQFLVYQTQDGKLKIDVRFEGETVWLTQQQMTNWRGATIRKQDVAVAKNYLTEPELAALNNLVEQYLIFAQGQAMRRVPMHMVDWVKKLDAFLTLNERDILTQAD